MLPCPVGALNIASFMLQNDEPFLFIHICSIRNWVILILLSIFEALERELFSYCSKYAYLLTGKEAVYYGTV